MGTDIEMLFFPCCKSAISRLEDVAHMEGSGCCTWRKINGAEESPGNGHPNDKGAVFQGEVFKN